MTKLTTKDVLYHVGRVLVGERDISSPIFQYNWDDDINLSRMDLPCVNISDLDSRVFNRDELVLVTEEGQQFRITCQPLQPVPDTSGGN